MYHEMTIAGFKRQLPLCQVNEKLYIAAFIMFGDPELTVSSAARLLAQAPGFDIIVTAESKGIPLAHEMARQSGNRKYVVLRKEPKLYMQDVISTNVDSITTDHIQTLCIGKSDADLIKDRRILIVDDVISTGESMLSMEALVRQAGGRIAGRMSVLAEGAAADRKDIVFLEKLPLFNPDGSIKED